MKRYLRLLAFVAGSVALLILLLYSLLPSQGRVSREMAVQASPAVIYHQIVQLHNYEKWFPWLAADPNAKVQFSQPSMGAGSFFTWDSRLKNLGSGKFEITATYPDSLVKFRMLYKNIPEADGSLIIQKDTHHPYCIVLWQVQVKAGWKPWLRLFSLMMDKMVGPALENGLTNLKIVCEQESPYVQYHIKEQSLPYTFIATESDTIAKSLLKAHILDTYSRLHRFVTMRHLTCVGEPIGQIDTMGNGMLQVNLGLPVNRSAMPDRRIRVLKMPNGFVVVAHYKGPYSKIGKAYRALSTYASEHAKTSPAPSWEGYMDGHFPLDDSSHSVNIYLPVYR